MHLEYRFLKTTLLTTFYLLIVGFFLNPTYISAAGTWDTEMQLSTVSGIGEDVAASGQYVHVLYGENEVYYKRSTNEGATWSAPVVLANGKVHLTDMIETSGSDVWLLYLKDIQIFNDWCCSRDAGNIYMRYSSDNGATWGPEKRLTTGAKAYRISLAVSGSSVHIVWMDYRTGNWDTRYLRSSDKGATWSVDTVLAAGVNGFGSERPQIAARGNEVYVVMWDDRASRPPCFTTPQCPDVYYMSSKDNGLTWSPIASLTASALDTMGGRPDVAIPQPNTVVITYDLDFPNETFQYAKRSTNGGSTWSAPVEIAKKPGAMSTHGSLVADNQSGVHAAWHDTSVSEADPLIIYRTSADSGVTWQPAEQITTSAARGATTPLLAASTNYVHAVWLDTRSGGQQVWYRRRTLAASTVTPSPTTPPISISPSPTPSRITPSPSTGGCSLKSQGDADCNGNMNLVDFEIWRKEFTHTVTTTQADFNTSGAVDLVDFEIWRKSFLK